MEHNHRPPSLNRSSFSPARPLSASPSPQHRNSQSSLRYNQYNPDVNEKSTPLTDFPGDRTRQLSISPSTRQQKCASPMGSRTSTHPRTARLHDVSLSSQARPSFQRQPTLLLGPNRAQTQTSYYTRPRGLRIANLIQPWLPLIIYAITSFAVVIAIALYKAEVFNRLDELSLWLQSDVQSGYAILFFLIFLTTFPPIPLYSTLITLSGYTFGPYTGAIVSYFAALTGALTVFIISRAFFRGCISRWLSSTLTVKRVVRAVENRPKLLFLIRLAPYPYNVMNCLLAASPTLTLRTYTICTALSLFKIIIHTSMGASIHSFKDYHVVDLTKAGEEHEHTIGELWTALGIALCLALLIYISIIARKAVDDELDDEPITSYDAEETIGFLGQSDTLDLEAGSAQAPMAESPFRNSERLTPYRFSLEPVQTSSQWS